MLEVRERPARVSHGVVLSAVAVAFVSSLMGCAVQVDGQLPCTHLDQGGEVAASHGRCGACHAGATRGDGTYESVDYTGIESLMGPEFSAEPNYVDPSITEGLNAESSNEGGRQ